jgi:glutathione S-transferase
MQMPRIDNPLSPLVPKLEGFHLFHFDGAPCAQRVRFAMAEKGLARGREVKFDADDEKSCAGEEERWVSRIVSLIKKDHLTDVYAKIQPNLVVPAFVHDGVLFTESMDIVTYIDELFGGEPLLPRHDERLMEDVQALTDVGKGLHRSIRFVTFRWGLGRLGMLNQKEEEQLKMLVQQGGDGEQLVDFYSGYDEKTIPDAVYQQHLDALAAGFAMLEKRLDDGRHFVTGNTLTMADVIWAMKVLRLDECGYPFAKCYPAVFDWFQRIASRPAFTSGVMAKNRGFNRAFRFKSKLENVLGVGLEKAVVRGVNG